jgi:hypothetical protein
MVQGRVSTALPAVPPEGRPMICLPSHICFVTVPRGGLAFGIAYAVRRAGRSETVGLIRPPRPPLPPMNGGRVCGSRRDVPARVLARQVAIPRNSADAMVFPGAERAT